MKPATGARFSFYPFEVLRAACIVVAIALAVSAAEGHARAAPAQGRVVLADPDPELLRAVKSTLAPWKLEVIVDAAPPADEDEAATRADARSARFVVWRREGALVVFDRDRGSLEERETTAGALDAVDAAAAALTVKTLMRLPPPEDGVTAEPAAQPIPGLRGQAELATRIARGSTTEVGGRLVAAVLVRPLPRLEWRLGLAADLGSPSRVARAGFKGTWTDWSVLALAGFTFRRGAWEVEPQLGAGVARSSFEGSDMSGGRHEHAALGVLRAGLTARRRLGRWTLGGAVGADRFLGTPTYTRLGSTAELFKVPGFAMAFGVLAAADFGGADW